MTRIYGHAPYFGSDENESVPALQWWSDNLLGLNQHHTAWRYYVNTPAISRALNRSFQSFLLPSFPVSFSHWLPTAFFEWRIEPPHPSSPAWQCWFKGNRASVMVADLCWPGSKSWHTSGHKSFHVHMYEWTGTKQVLRILKIRV